MAQGGGLVGLVLAAATAVGCHSGITPTLRPTTPPPAAPRRHLTVRRFLAFGDSLTEGAATPAPPGDTAPRDRSYPIKLQELLTTDFTQDEPMVVNGGRGGELASDALPRLTQLIDSTHPDVVMLMEGVNDLNKDGDVAHALAAVRSLILAAEDHGTRVIVATLPPERRGGSRAGTIDLRPAFDTGVVRLAGELHVPVADVHDAMTLDMIAPDGLHILDAGNERIAQVFLDAIARAFTRDTAVESK